VFTITDIVERRVDSIVNAYLAETVGNGQPPPEQAQRGLVVNTQTNYFRSLAYPDVAELGLRINHLGSSSVRYEIGIFARGDPLVKAVGELTHVYVDRDTGRPASQGMDESVRAALKRIQVSPEERSDNGGASMRATRLKPKM
jgi:acyl-CoA thioester hydrolase